TRTFAPCCLRTPPRGGSPCIITRPSPPSGWPEDFHLQTAEHAQHTTKPLVAADASRSKKCGRLSGECGDGLTELSWVTRRNPVTHLRKAMLEELQRRNLSQITIRIYLR